ncbi:hypothetical protein SEPCBS57363_003263 [Sporothrix epigloea]|uniref:ATP-dependent DNA ligase family profile domain-containing protein n=1 Tax=Sporothrix epigloea TaxID=1892477 RepID=A0ABP0DKK1_9PEZI
MPFLFAHVCDLFQQIEDLLPANRNQPCVVNQVIQAWFGTHRKAIEEMVPDADMTSSSTSPPAATSSVALLSTLLPDRRTDRVYGLQARGLQRILIRALGLGHSRIPELSRWMRPCEHGTTGPVDLADCVEAILERTPNPVPAVPVSVEEVDAVLHSVAARCRFSGPAIRGGAAEEVPHTQSLTRMYQRLDARGAKWFTRVMLKDLRPVVLNGITVARAFRPDLPLALQVHDDLTAAVPTLQRKTMEGVVGGGRPSPPRPQLGTKVGRQRWIKGRSIQNCITIAGPQRMSCEHKLDGEYVQVHVDLTKDKDGVIQLFSKSGKDSTWDRVQLHGVIRDSLRLGQPDCRLTQGCILEGEMLAYDDRSRTVLGFDAIRRYVNRSGTRLYVDPRDEAEAKHCQEHLMIVYYDVLAVDDEPFLPLRHEERFRRLEDLIACRPGYAELVPREVIDFSAQTAPALLRQAFARCLTARLEGLVLKPEDQPYFNLSGDCTGAGSSSIIKLKRGYVGGFGEVGDLAVLGGRYDAVKAREYPADLRGVHWTHFYLGCRDKAKSSPGRPRFVVTNVVTLPVVQMTTFLKYCRPRTVRVGKRNRKEMPRDTEVSDSQLPFDVARIEPSLEVGQNGPMDWFADPPVVEIRCFSFHRQGYGLFWSPRFPNVTKFHFDRSSLTDVLTYDELQAMAEEATTLNQAALEAGTPKEGAGEKGGGDEEHTQWVERLKKADRRGIAMDAETSQSSAASTMSQSQQKSQQSQQLPPVVETRRVSGLVTAAPLAILPETSIEIEDIHDDKSSQVVEITESKSCGKKMAIFIDLTSDDEKGDTETDGNTESANVLTPRPTSNGMPPALPVTPRIPRTPLQIVSPLAPTSWSPIDIVSSLTAWSSDASQDDSQDSRETVVEPSKVKAQGENSSSENRRCDDATPRKHAWSQEVATLYPVVSPPILKRARSAGWEREALLKRRRDDCRGRVPH